MLIQCYQKIGDNNQEQKEEKKIINTSSNMVVKKEKTNKKIKAKKNLQTHSLLNKPKEAKNI